MWGPMENFKIDTPTLLQIASLGLTEAVVMWQRVQIYLEIVSGRFSLKLNVKIKFSVQSNGTHLVA